jgi:hypothetical protein
MITETLKQQVAGVLIENPHWMSSEIAQFLNVTESEATQALPNDMVVCLSGEASENILTEIVTWGKVTTIVHSGGSIFEYKAPFPKGKMAYGYYNLMGREGQLHGHLKLENINLIALVSKPFRGSDSHYFGFFNQHGECIFKVYLGRDVCRKLLPEQVVLFQQLKEVWR